MIDDTWSLTLGPPPPPVQDRGRRSGAAWRQRFVLLEQADLEVEGLVDDVAVRRKPAVGDTEHQLRAHHPLEVDAVKHLLHVRQHLPGKLDLTQAERAALARRAEPTEEKPDHLPQRVEPEAARHHRIALEVTEEEPEVWLDVEFRAYQSLAVLAALFGNFRDAVEHKHRRQRQLGVARPEQFAPATGQQIFVLEAVTLGVHKRDFPALRAGRLYSHARIRNTPRLAGKDGVNAQARRTYWNTAN